MKKEIEAKRIIIAGNASGAGKTTFTTSLLYCLKKRKKQLSAFKCGPDYIDPMFHEKVFGISSGNLDCFFYDERTVKALFADYSNQYNIIEGVMGYYDGDKGSAYSLSNVLDSKSILLINGKGACTSILATLKGFLTYKSPSNIVGVVLNNTSKRVFDTIKEEIKLMGIEPLGYIPKLITTLESRHLGLIQADEIENIADIISRIANEIEKTVNIDKIIELIDQSSIFSYEPLEIKKEKEVTIGVTRDEAFTFVYRENIDLLKKMGAKIVYFSPMHDNSPPKVDGLYILGGYPENHLEALNKNTQMMENLRIMINNGTPTIAECGGFMYLTNKISDIDMVGFINAETIKKDKLVRFGYVTLRAKHDNLILKKGQEVKAHEFHYYDTNNNGVDFEAKKTNGLTYDAIHSNKSLYVGFPHLAFYSNIEVVKNFIDMIWRKRNGKN